MANGVFISYRRDDSQWPALAISEALRWAVGRDAVFIDRSGLRAGDDYSEVLQRRVQEARVVVAVLGPGWLGAQDAAGLRRLDDPHDWVRRELAAALPVADKVLPVLVQGFTWPADPKLPLELTDLPGRNGHTLTADQWDTGLHALVQRLGQLGVPLQPPLSDGARNPDGSHMLTGLKPPAQQGAHSVLSGQVLAAARAPLPEWTPEWNPHPWAVEGLAQELTRHLVFDSFQEAVDFMQFAAPAFDLMNPVHHPRWQQQWRTLTVWFSTWDVGCRITQLDIDAARAFNRLYAQHLVTWRPSSPP